MPHIASSQTLNERMRQAPRRGLAPDGAARPQERGDVAGWTQPDGFPDRQVRR